MSQWNSSDSGILRKNKVDDNLDQLLVFGYSCKIFRDDEKAIYIDQGKHLIPWMGDETVKIDRYDGRGTLSDLKKFEASREGYDTLRWLGLSESEKKLEELCDNERYYALKINEEEEEMYKEEAAKRQKTNAFAFDYNTTQAAEITVPPKEGIPTVPEKEEEDEPYEPAPGLDVPIDIDIPKTVKEYIRIEKTALFVCKQGPQMEILIKARQANNPQFSFLTLNDPLYKFYCHLLSALKNGRYHPQHDKKTEENEKVDAQADEQNSHYLHPSLLSAGGKPSTPPATTDLSIPTIPYRPSADCAYSQLVNRIQAGLGLGGPSEPSGSPTTPPNSLPSTQGSGVPSQMQIIGQLNLEQLYHQYYYVQQFYEYWRHTIMNSAQGALYAGLPPNFNQLDQNMQGYIHQHAWAQFVHHHQKQIQEAQQSQASNASNNNNSYAQIVSNLNKDGINPYSANVPPMPPPEPTAANPKNVSNGENTNKESTISLVKYENDVKKPLLSLAAAYGSGSESDTDSSDSEDHSSESAKKRVVNNGEVYRIPSGEMQTVIDKMAEYVSKNGEQFEEIIRQKSDTRFDFLNEGHEFNKYYRKKLASLKGEPSAPKADESKTKSKSKKAIVAPVSFSIKKPKEEHSKEIKSVLSEDSDEENPSENAPSADAPATANVSKQVVPKVAQASVTILPQPVTAQMELVTEQIAEIVTSKTPEQDASRKRSRSRSLSPNKTTKVRSPTATPSSKRTKSRSKTPDKKKSPIVIKDSPERIIILTPAEDPKTARSKKPKPPVIDMFDAGSNVENRNKEANGVLERDDPILEMLQLDKHEMNIDDKASDAQEKARQLERKRKAAMFLKLKSVEVKPSNNRSTRKSPTSSLSSSRRNSNDSIILVRSRSRTREKSDIKETRHKKRSRSRDHRREKKHKKHKDRSRSRDNDDDRRRKDKKKKSKHSKSKKHSKRRRDSRSRSSSRSRSKSIYSRRRSRSKSDSAKSHISIDSS